MKLLQNPQNEQKLERLPATAIGLRSYASFTCPGLRMQLRHMLWAPHRVPVCVFERTRKNGLTSDRRLIFLGRMTVSPVLFMGAAGYFAYLADRDRFRSVVLSELKRIMSFADLDNTYHVEDWFLARNRLFVYVAKRSRRIGGGFDMPYKRALSWLARRFSVLH